MQSTTTRTTSRLKNSRHIQTLRGLWVIIVVLHILLFVASLPAEYLVFRDAPRWGVGFQAAFDQIGMSRDFFAAYITALDIFEVMFSLGLSIIIFRQRSDDWVAWMVSVMIVVYAVSLTLAFYLSAPLIADFVRSIIPALVIGTMAVYPDGRFFPSWTRWLVSAIAFIGMIEFALIVTGVTGGYQFGYLGYPLGILALLQRYRDAKLTTIERQQVKWVLWGVIAAFFAAATYFLIPMLFPQLASIDSDTPVYTVPSLISFLVTNTLRLSSSVIFVASLGLSIVQYRLWDIDLTINRSLVYGTLTLGLGGLFVLLFLVSQALLTAVLGSTQSGVAVALSAAVTALLFNPARKRVQRFVDRRIYGFKFDLNELHAAQQKPEVKNPGMLTGRTFGDYEVLGVLGRGGMGEVYQGFGKGQQIALKVLPADLAEQTEFLKRFEREAEVMKRLDHPHIVKLIDAGNSEGIHYLALEYVDGMSLSDYMKQQGALSAETTCAFIVDIAQALDYAHEQGLVHRDIKPSNVMLRTSREDVEETEAVLMDFGIARLMDSKTRYTGSGAIGTIDYMAPEQILAAREVDRRADVYALGVMAYEMLTGRHPFEGGAAQIMFAHLQQPPPHPRTFKPDLTESAAQALLRALAKNPDERFATAGEFAQAL